MHCDYLTVEITLIKSETFKYTIHIEIDLLTSNGFIIESCYYDFKDNACIVFTSLWK